MVVISRSAFTLDGFPLRPHNPQTYTLSIPCGELFSRASSTTVILRS